MKLRKIETNELLEEQYCHEDNSFPVILCTDDYTELFDHTLDIHYHHDIEYTLVLDGKLDYYINGAGYRVAEGDCIFINSDTLHMVKSADPLGKSCTFVTLFPPSFLSKEIFGNFYQRYFQPISGKTLTGFIISQGTPASYEIRHILRQIQMLDKEEFGYELSCLGLLYQLWKATLDYIREENPLVFSNRRDHKGAEIAKAMLMHIHQNYGDHLNISSISQAISVSKSECFRCFKLYTKQTPIEYINNYRLEQAEKMLIDTACSITEISYACGFCSSSYFTKLFKKKHGMSPRQYKTIHA